MTNRTRYGHLPSSIRPLCPSQRSVYHGPIFTYTRTILISIHLNLTLSPCQMTTSILIISIKSASHPYRYISRYIGLVTPRICPASYLYILSWECLLSLILILKKNSLSNYCGKFADAHPRQIRGANGNYSSRERFSCSPAHTRIHSRM